MTLCWPGCPLRGGMYLTEVDEVVWVGVELLMMIVEAEGRCEAFKFELRETKGRLLFSRQRWRMK